MKYLGKLVQSLSPMDIEVLEVIEHGRTYSFHVYLIQQLLAADGTAIERLRVYFPEVVASFERWKSGESGYLYSLPVRTHLRIVK